MPVPNIAADFANILNQDTPPPRGGADMAMHLQDARRYKTANNKQEWKNSLDQFKIKSDQAQLAQKEASFQRYKRHKKSLLLLVLSIQNWKTKTQMKNGNKTSKPNLLSYGTKVNTKLLTFYLYTHSKIILTQ